jgi:hypothetical protein
MAPITSLPSSARARIATIGSAISSANRADATQSSPLPSRPAQRLDLQPQQRAGQRLQQRLDWCKLEEAVRDREVVPLLGQRHEGQPQRLRRRPYADRRVRETGRHRLGRREMAPHDRRVAGHLLRPDAGPGKLGIQQRSRPATRLAVRDPDGQA